MDKYIDSDLAIKDIQETYCKPCKKRGDDYHGVMCRACFSGDCIDVIDRQPEADVQPVVHAHWIEHKLTKGGSLFECSKCGEEFEFEAGTPQSSCYYYCPYCGAKIDGDEHDNG